MRHFKPKAYREGGVWYEESGYPHMEQFGTLGSRGKHEMLHNSSEYSPPGRATSLLGVVNNISLIFFHSIGSWIALCCRLESLKTSIFDSLLRSRP